jgi:hypothetical protein
MGRRVLFLGGNGHCAARLIPAQTALAELMRSGVSEGFVLIDVPYAGFEGRARAYNFDGFLGGLAQFIASELRHGGETLLYGTGIGGLLALCLRSRGDCLDVPILLQAPVLWGLEHRRMPRLLRLGPARLLLRRLFSSRWFQAWFVRKQFERPLLPTLRQAFFQGYADCAAATDFFTWLSPSLLRDLEARFACRPDGLGQINVWWGGRDSVVTLQELAWTEKALGMHWPVRTFPSWGHYPMIDEPRDWVRELSHALATPEGLPRTLSPQAE